MTNTGWFAAGGCVIVVIGFISILIKIIKESPEEESNDQSE